VPVASWVGIIEIGLEVIYMAWSEAQKRYMASDRGKAARRKYQTSPKGQATRAAYMARRKAKLAETKQTKVIIANEPEGKLEQVKKEVKSKK